MEMTENQKNYEPLIVPFSKPFIELSKKESQEYFDWFISHIDERSEYLKKKVSDGLGVPIKLLDYSLESLKPIWKWFLQMAETTKQPKVDSKQLEKALEGQPQIVRCMIEDPGEVLSVFTEFVLRDIGMYVAKMFTSNYPVLKWTVKRMPKRYVHVNEPLIIGFIDDNENYPKPFHPDLEPIDLARTPAMKLIRNVQPHDDDLYNECKKWVGWIPKNETDF